MFSVLDCLVAGEQGVASIRRPDGTWEWCSPEEAAEVAEDKSLSVDAYLDALEDLLKEWRAK